MLYQLNHYSIFTKQLFGNVIWKCYLTLQIRACAHSIKNKIMVYIGGITKKMINLIDILLLDKSL
jgi:hypothetical protein